MTAIHDPLSINLTRQCRSLISKIPAGSPYAVAIEQSPSPGALLKTLSHLLAVPALTLSVATAFRPLLFDLCARWLSDAFDAESQLIALSMLLEPHQELYPILSSFLRKNYNEVSPLEFATAESLRSIAASRLHRLLLAYYRILQANRPLPHDLFWPLTHLADLFLAPHPDRGVCLLAIRCYALQSGMNEAQKETLEEQVLGEGCGMDCQTEFGESPDGVVIEIDGWILPVLEIKRITDARNALVTEPQDYYSAEEGPSLTASALSPLVANIHGILLLRSSAALEISTPLISTPTTVESLRSLAIALSLRVPTLLTSPPSSGKSLLLSHLAAILYPSTKNQIITIHLADTSLDPRSLLGSYISSPTRPGTFEWKDGVLVRAMREGKWIVFEDIDRGTNEVLGVVKPLVESLGLGKWLGGRAAIEVPSRGRVEADEGFALFATRSLSASRNGNFPPPVFFGAHKFHEVTVFPPTLHELRTILDSRFPRLAGSAVQALIRLWEAIRALGSAASSRDIGLRELEKFCLRVDNLLPTSYQPMDTTDGAEVAIPLWTIYANPSLREDMYLEARDVFFGAGALTSSARTHVHQIAAVVAEHIGLESERSAWVLQGRTPEFDIEKDVNGRTIAVRVGRTRLPARITKVEIAPPVTRPFAMHRPAVMLLSRIATAVSAGEPVLLTGETGTGKTSVITHLASLLRHPLISLNLSHQTEASDLVGGFKPVDARIPGFVLQERFLELFGSTFSRRKNAKFEESVRKAVGEAKWKRAVGLWKESTRLAKDRLQARLNEEPTIDSGRDVDPETPRKRRKVESLLNVSEANWIAFEQDVDEFHVQHVQGKGKFAFGFVEGPLVKALRSGDWILLDEINLASPETLECISGLLHGPTASITLTEQGSLEPVPRHPDFRLFACMNPATDVGKKDLPPNIRSRFTEIDVPPPDADRETLLGIVTQYIGPSAVGDKAAIMDVAEFYSAVKQLAEGRHIADGSNHKPHYSMRTLARALTFTADMASTYSLRRALWEGCLMAFTMVLDAPSAHVVTTLAQKHILAGVRNPRSLLAKEPAVPHSRTANELLKLGPFYLEKGPLPEDPVEDYIMTPSVETKLVDLARIIVTGRFPVLIEGPTSSGKTSSVEYLARRTGHRFIRINNHEHTDIQEYLGSYVSDPMTGKLVFKDGLLVRALRSGDWIVLDELNLAPTDVLEALNRLLDDNRELVIPETQEVVRPHPHFMLFATQNPSGLYAGRKVLSRAFRNRFLEVHFEDVPQAELETILCQRCRIAPSYGQRIVAVFRELQKRRQSGRVFESKHGFATLRDLFRWAGRDAVGYQELAENGYMLLAERARREDDKIAVKEVIESIMKVRIDETVLYNASNTAVDLTAYLGFPFPSSSPLVWTAAMRRLFFLVSRALRFNEPILLVGETGSGKTSVCQVYADAVQNRLHGLNCHQNTETADLIGGLRPLRNRATDETEALDAARAALESVGARDVTANATHVLAALETSLILEVRPEMRQLLENARCNILRLKAIFEWHDGPLIEAMRQGDVFLLDEISLADDSVLERLNSVLEPARTVVLAERGGDDLEHPAIRAADGFQLIATMNPGGDYGKKELSPALRNRFTEIWVPSVDNRDDLQLIVNSLWQHVALQRYTMPLLDFVEWLCARVTDRSMLSLRDILAWITFSNAAYHSGEDNERMPVDEIFHHAAYMTYLDGLGSLPQLAAYSPDAIRLIKTDAITMLQQLVPLPSIDEPLAFVPALDPSKFMQLGSFAIPTGTSIPASQSFNFQAPTTRDNAMRVVRACQVAKPILLEGSPGVGKTSLITALANLSGHHLCRINLSDQTDLIDLFGSDLPVEGGGAGEFAWKDAEFLRALQEGHWVLLDEMNLAPQAVLEGLNAVLDHRGTVFIPELGRSFTRHPSFRIFAAQNPLQQGGGRKGLPRSFVNRFTKVYIEELSTDDLMMVCRHLFPTYDPDVLRAMVEYNVRLNQEILSNRTFARLGSPWEFNLRDLVRWGLLLATSQTPQHPAEYLRSIYLHRFRTPTDRNRARNIFDRIFSTTSPNVDHIPHCSISSSWLQIGHFSAPRGNRSSTSRPGRILQTHLPALESAGHCVAQSWLVILTGPHGSGKTDAVRVLADLTGNRLHEISMNSATDAMDILGSFEQVDNQSRVEKLVRNILSIADQAFWSVSACGTQRTDDYWTLRKSITQPSRFVLSDVLRTASNLLLILDDLTETMTAECKSLQTQIQGLLAVPDSAGRFEWVDGPLVRALKNGHWLLLDGANLCSPSVLDRLNSLCETNGTLTLTERGYVDGDVPTIRPHPNFKLFMSVDPQFGELSRAMRNRGVEIAMFSEPTPEDQRTLLDHFRLPLVLSISDPKWTSLSAHYDAIRRGLSSHNGCAAIGPRWPSGLNVSLDSASSFLADLSPFLYDSPSGSTNSDIALLHLLSRATPPAYLPKLHRLLPFLVLPQRMPQIRELLELLNLKDSQVTVVLSGLRERRGVPQGASFEYLQAEPLDIYMNCLPCHECDMREEGPSTHRMVIQILNLVVAMVVYRAETEELRKTQRVLAKADVRSLTRESMDGSRRALEAINMVIDAIMVTANTVLDHLGQTVSLGKHVDLDTASRLLSYGRLLRNVAANDSFDYSVAQATSKWVAETIQGSTPDFFHLQGPTQSLKDAISLSSGLGITEIWLTFMVDRSTTASRIDLQGLDNAACNIDSMPDGPSLPIVHDALQPELNYQAGLRTQTFQVMAIRTLPVISSKHDEVALLELEKQIQALLLSQSPRSKSGALDDNSILIAELRVLGEFGGTESESISNDTVQLVRDILNLACETPHASLLRFTSYQHLIWATDTKHPRIPIIMQCQLQWLTAIWSLRSVVSNGLGPSLLLTPMQLSGTLQKCDWKGISLSSLVKYEANVRRHATLVLMQCSVNIPRINQLSGVLLQALLMLFSCFRNSFGDQFHSLFAPFTQACQLGSTRLISEVLDVIGQSTNLALRRAVQQHLHPAIHQFSSLAQPRLRHIFNLGWCWISLSRVMIDLFIPDAPIDPAAVQQCAQEFWHNEESILRAQIELHAKMELRTAGNNSNSVIVYLETRLGEVLEHLDQLTSGPPKGRQDITRLHSFWSEVFQFQTQVVSTSKIDSLLHLFEKGDASAYIREQVIQESIAGFCHRIETVYPEFDDILNPLKLALLYLRFGLRLASHNQTNASQDAMGSSNHICAALVAFPTVRSTAMISMPLTDINLAGVTPFRRVLLNIAAVAFERSIGVSMMTHVHTIETSYEQAFRLWSIDRARKDQKDQESQSLYRRKALDYDADDEGEVEEREFLALFPTFEDVIDEAGRVNSASGKNTDFVASLEIQSLVAVHYTLFGQAVGAPSNAAGVFKQVRMSALESLLNAEAAVLPETMDVESRALQFDLLRDRLSELHGAPESKESCHFYSDANVLEVKKATAMVDSLRNRLSELIQEWPDQMVLQHLRHRCEAIISLDLQSSVAKVLSALEQLLLQTQDWEIYANRENTLKNHQHSLTTLIVEWRRLELSCWKALLQSQALSFAEGASESWFHLYDICVRGPLADAQDSADALKQYLSQFTALLDDFIRSSPLGQYQTRLRLLHTFDSYVGLLAPSKNEQQRTTLSRVQNLLRTTSRYYSRFSAQIAASLSEQRVKLEKEVQAFIKLASWKDVNVHALKQSAQRTHHNLYKVVRKFREVMRQPVSGHLQSIFAGDTEGKRMEFETLPSVRAITLKPTFISEGFTPSAVHLANLDHTYQKFHSYLADRIQNIMQLPSASNLDDLASEIIVTAKSLANESVSRDLPATKRDKLQKALLVRKRKAWSDLLKELKRGGLSANIKPDTLRQQSDHLWVREQPILCAETTISIARVDLYFDRLHATLPQLRTSLADHHSDITTRELRRGVMLLESGFTHGLNARSMLAQTLEAYRKTSQLFNRLQSFVTSKTVSFYQSAFKALSRIHDVACKLADALVDIIHALDTFNNLHPNSSNFIYLTESVRAISASARASSDGLAQIMLSVDNSSSWILLYSEFTLLSDVCHQFKQTSAALGQWSNECPVLQYVFQPVQIWLDAQDISLPSPISSQSTTSLDGGGDSVIDTILVNVQIMLLRCSKFEDNSFQEDNDNYIKDSSHVVFGFTEALSMDGVFSQLLSVLPRLAALSHDEREQNINRFLPFLKRYITLAEDQLTIHSRWASALFKLDFVICSVMHTIATQGFCKPPETDDSGSGGDTTESTSGVGLGEGSGTENVSKEIEDESQVEGIQGEEEDKNKPRDDAGDDNAIEMSQDFGGAMEDVPESGSQDEAGSDDESEGVPEEQLGDLDASDPSAVDEKLWGDEKGPQDDEEQGKTNEDHSTEKEGDAEVVAKEGQQSQSKESKKGEEEKSGEEQAEEDNIDDMMLPEDAEMEDGDDRQDASGAPMDDHLQDADTLDLPDDMDLGLGDDAQEDGKGDHTEGVSEPEELEDNLDDRMDTSAVDEGNAPEPEPTEEDISGGQLQETADQQDAPEPEEQSDKDAVAKPDVSDGNATSDTNQAQNMDTKESASTGQEGSGSGGAGGGGGTNNDQTKEDSADVQDVDSLEARPASDEAVDTPASGSATRGQQKGSAPSQPDSALSNNPLRSLGDTLKEIRQRFNDILNSQEQTDPSQNQDDTVEASQVEYLNPDDEDQNMQALGPAGEEQVAKLDELRLADDDGQMLDSSALMDIDPATEEPSPEMNSIYSAPQGEPTSQALAEGVDGALVQSDIQGPAMPLQNHDHQGLSMVKSDVEMGDVEEDKDVEAELRDWQDNGQPDAGAEHIWRLYESLTHDLAYALCEQLRLILEPTLATRLKGDYRTGKRLNMKKIISYIASDYTKNKIWLRRTRPSQREYQVLIALDDSRSMAESHSVHLAYETMALVSKALSRLEVGDIAIAKFGETVEMLHSFDQGPFTDQAGTKVMNAFRFNQKATNVLSLVDISLKVLEVARERRSMSSASATDLWQLEIIISDGICQDHDRLRTVLRKAEEQRVMIVFIVIDSLHSAAAAASGTDATSANQSSILAMNQVAYKNVDGRMELQMERYLDSFPFEYYVVLRSVEALPEVLTGTLKQFFERISEE